MPLPKFFALPASPNRVFGLDLMRAFAIIVVMVTHAIPYVSPKFTFFYKYALRCDGVGIFFVLSGYLIGSILIKTLETKPATFATLWDFWLKRWIRTVPPYWLVMSFALVLYLRTAHFSVGQSLQYYLFVQNLNWPHPLYFYGEGWSLAVEEWFYLLSAPFIFGLVALSFKPKTAVPLAAIVVIVLSTLHRYFQYQLIPVHDFVEWDIYFRKIVLMRLDSLMYGVIAAWLAFYHKELWVSYKLPKFIFGLAWLFLQPSPSGGSTFSLFTCVYYFACPAIATALMLPFLSAWQHASGSAGKAITHIALISYSLYLVHSTLVNNNFVIPFIRSLPVSQSVGAVIGMSLYWSVSFVLATLLYKYFEVPVMGLRSRLKVGAPVEVPA